MRIIFEKPSPFNPTMLKTECEKCDTKMLLKIKHLNSKDVLIGVFKKEYGQKFLDMKERERQEKEERARGNLVRASQFSP